MVEEMRLGLFHTTRILLTCGALAAAPSSFAQAIEGDNEAAAPVVEAATLYRAAGSLPDTAGNLRDSRGLFRIPGERPGPRPVERVRSRRRAGGFDLAELPGSDPEVRAAPDGASAGRASMAATLRDKIGAELEKIDDTSSPAAIFQTMVAIVDHWHLAADIEQARRLVRQTLALPKVAGILSDNTVSAIRATAADAVLESKASLVAAAGSIVLDAVLERYVDDYVPRIVDDRLDQFVVAGLHEAVDGAAALAPSLAVGAASTSAAPIYGLAKVAEVLVALEAHNSANADLVASAIESAKLQMLMLEFTPGYGLSEVISYHTAQTAIATKLMTGSGLNVHTGRRLSLVHAVMMLRANQILGLPTEAAGKVIDNLVATYDATPGNWWDKWAKAANFGRDGLRDYAGFAGKAAEALEVDRGGGKNAPASAPATKSSTSSGTQTAAPGPENTPRGGGASGAGGDRAADSEAAGQRWGAGIVVPESVDLGYRPCGDREDVRACLREKGVPEAAIDFSISIGGDTPGEVFARKFRELGTVDLARVRFIGNTIYRWPVLLNGPAASEAVDFTDDLRTAFADSASRGMLAQHPRSDVRTRRISGHRTLGDGTQRFVLVESVIAGCMACEILGSAVTFIDIGAATGGKIIRKPVGLLLDGSRAGEEPTAATIRRRPEILQFELNKLGYDAGPMDGYPGPRTRGALMTFQVEHCLPPTGQPGTATLERLREASSFEAPCAAGSLPEGITATTPLRSGMYVDKPAKCGLEQLPFETVHLSQRIIRNDTITWGQEGVCETARTDIRDGITLFRGSCDGSNQSTSDRWRLDILSNEAFIDLDMPAAASSAPPRKFTRCPRGSALRQNWDAWFGESQ